MKKKKELVKKLQSYGKYKCQSCGKYIYNKCNLCLDCFNKYRETYIMYNNKIDIHNKVRKPTKEELKKMIYNLPFTSIGKLYKVSDKAVEKWCSKYGIDYHYNALKNNPEREIYKTEIIHPIIQKKIKPIIIQPIRFE